MAEVPKAEKIIRRRMADFHAWKEQRKHAPFLKAMRKTLEHIDTDLLPQIRSTGHRDPDIGLEIHQIIRHYAKKVRQDPRYGCHFIEAITMSINEKHNNRDCPSDPVQNQVR